MQGHLDPSWQEWLEGGEIVHEEGGTSQLSGTLADQAALSGVLVKLDRLRVMLLSLLNAAGGELTFYFGREFLL